MSPEAGLCGFESRPRYQQPEGGRRRMADLDERIKLQRDESTAPQELAKQTRPVLMTAVVDDDYPEVRHEYDGAADEFVRRYVANRGRRHLEHVIRNVK